MPWLARPESSHVITAVEKQLPWGWNGIEVLGGQNQQMSTQQVDQLSRSGYAQLGQGACSWKTAASRDHRTELFLLSGAAAIFSYGGKEIISSYHG